MTTSVLSFRAGWLKWLVIGLAAALALALFFFVPFRPLLRALRQPLEGLGVVGMGMVAGLYVVAVLLLLPGSVFSVASGLIFGLWWGLATVVAASTVTVVIAFLIARYAGREAVERMARRHPRFEAVDRAVGEAGWKIVALLRLSPILPFGLQNYVYGLTSIGFWPCVVTSFLAMLPGSFMYVYIGYLARAGVTAGAQGSVDPGRWALRLAGLGLTVVAIVFVTRRARKILKAHGALEA